MCKIYNTLDYVFIDVLSPVGEIGVRIDTFHIQDQELTLCMG